MASRSAQSNENSFPIERVTAIRVGAAHDEGSLARILAFVNLLRALSEQVNACFSPAAAGEPIWVKVIGSEAPVASNDAPAGWEWYDARLGSQRFQNGLKNPLLPTGPHVARENERRWKPSPAQLIIGQNLFLCVFVRGFDPDGEPCYCYFGTHFDQIAEVLRCARDAKPFNPADLKGAAVLARQTGEPPAEVRRFLNERFSFEETGIIFELKVR